MRFSNLLGPSSRILRSAVGLVSLFAVWITSLASAPNIVVIVADDLNWDDVGFMGRSGIRTPHLDQMAAEGMIFERAFVTISSCSPSRASVMTGRYPHSTGAEELHWPLPKDQELFVDALRANGYWTGAAGKWHLGDAAKERFDRVMEVDTSGFQLPAGAEGATGEFRETAVGDAKSGCADWIPLLRDRPKERPFFAWLAALDPHRPYDERILENPTDPDDVRVAPYHPNTAETREDYAKYYDEAARLDRFVGLVLDELVRQGVADSTFVLFFSDNGRPFPRDKTTLYDSGIRSPFVVKWPGIVPAGTRARSLVSSVDIAPTLLELSGSSPLASADGVSFLPVLQDPSASVRDFVFAEKNWHDFEDHARAVRSARFKLIRNYYSDLPNTPPADAVRSPTYQEMLRLKENDALKPTQYQLFTAPRPYEEFYDILADPHEIRNLAGDPNFADAQDRLGAELDAWERRTGDYVPSLRTADEFDRVTGKPTAPRVRPRWSREKMVKAGLAAP